MTLSHNMGSSPLTAMRGLSLLAEFGGSCYGSYKTDRYPNYTGLHLWVIMRLFYYTFAFFLLRNPAGVIAKYLLRKNIGNDLLGSTPVQSLVLRDETGTSEIINDINLFTPPDSATDPSFFLPELSESDDLCPMETSLEDDEGGSFELSDSEALWTRGLENEDPGPFSGSSDLQCRRRRTKPKKPKKEVVPQEPSLWPLVYPEVPEGRCPDLIRPIAACCAGRDGMKPLDCWPCTSGLINDTLLETNRRKLVFGSAGAWLGISIAVGASIR